MKKRDEIRWKELLNVFAVSKFTLYSGEIGVGALSAEFLDHLQKVPRMLRQIPFFLVCCDCCGKYRFTADGEAACTVP